MDERIAEEIQAFKPVFEAINVATVKYGTELRLSNGGDVIFRNGTDTNKEVNIDTRVVKAVKAGERLMNLAFEAGITSSESLYSHLHLEVSELEDSLFKIADENDESGGAEEAMQELEMVKDMRAIIDRLPQAI
ncbi:MAG: hypothetical protein UV73_C0005G0040 [Candidatus Gottesmanbacteria bacterium GW2011_GWA2_43_14]|uniref:Uncharacterized protein n=1 Tax=Candidatus Gottesmanbacteria bacterium GW2011_GWA2_43_14 TaxID=1618443 RepID=A0A0G1GG09_9BACT|nr:MAG: hypothetical protein UV73_C0005G0040 [Candidatus Gottesmanbacteria bacterium GW2011_GWA2_43_14]